MIPSIDTLDPQVAARLEGVFFDIDDTFTTAGRIHAPAFTALWRLKECGLRAVPITGRPAGWCDHIARMWPVDGVVGENGAFYFWMDDDKGRLRKRFLEPEEMREESRRRLTLLGREILESVPGTALAGDQRYREADLAIDFCEDVPPLGWDSVDRICEIFQHRGARCKVSSIHVNGWFGDYDKLKMTKLFVREQWGLDLDEFRDRVVFCGDSPNDEPMFRYFPHSAGVRNVLRFTERMTHLPAFVAHGQGGEGFAEIISHLLDARGSVEM